MLGRRHLVLRLVRPVTAAFAAGIFVLAIALGAHAADNCTTYMYNGDHHHDGDPPSGDNTCGGGDHDPDITEVFTMGTGRDTVNGHDGRDEIYGNSGGDTLNGGGGDDHLYMGDGTDRGDGGDGSDYVYGSGGFEDIILGGDGRDLVQDTVSDGGHDTLCGKAGLDTYNSEDGSQESDFISAQRDEADRIHKDLADGVNYEGCEY